MRVRVIIIGFFAMAAIIGIAAYLALIPQQEVAGPHSLTLAASIVGYTNYTEGGRQAILEVRNHGLTSVWLDDVVRVRYFDQMRSADSHMLTNAGELKPGSTQSFCFPVPTHRLRWRAEIGGVNYIEAAVKQKLKATAPLKNYPFALHPRYACTEWIMP